MKPRREGDGSGSEQGPRLYSKVVHNSAIKYGLLRLPKIFAGDHRESLSDYDVRLETPDGAVWPMEVMKLEDDIFLRNGWPEFAAFYSICQACQLLFTFKENSNPSVRIIDRNFREITYPPKPTRDVENVSRKRKGNSLAPNVQSEGNQNGGTLKKKSNLETSNIALTQAEALQSKIDNPSFFIVMRPTYVRGEFLAIPAAFAQKYLGGKEETTFTLQVSNGKEWKTEVKFKVHIFRNLSSSTNYDLSSV
ncbi:hypothetical protein COLO4_08811 [Corchorus olitorius]|uniref:TF-B3 domain-containing protein n=1 Tax=Corchorus olitorius TaxID=93759 RepID=A0A1R3KEI7_9ROSI|nr:hypothetical protein COLO4_08811 [Corchorus olitorius]